MYLSLLSLGGAFLLRLLQPGLHSRNFRLEARDLAARAFLRTGVLLLLRR